MSWNEERLERLVESRMSGRKLVVVANREPYIHSFDGEEIRCVRPASGLTTALDPVMRACRGVWVAHGSGDADRAVVDPQDRVAVPPEDPSYTLRRVWLTRSEEQGYYYGFANQALWPLCHIAYTRPRFESSDWEYYRAVNQKFAEVILEEVADEPAMVFVQDYHFALLPRMLRNAREDLTIAQFWHIPWPNREAFRVCPWQEEILDGLLGNDLLSFHIQYHCNNFLDTVERAIEARVDMERFCVTRGGRTTNVQPHPISVDLDMIASQMPVNLAAWNHRLRRRLRLRNERILVGVDRVDYTKGIPEKFRAVERLLELHPELKGTFSLVQIGAPSRQHIPAYRDLGEELHQAADDINWRHGQGSWRPIVLVHEHWGVEELLPLYRLAHACVVGSLHDGMNLVAKEFVAARDDLRGALVLSEFTGAARELAGALLVNPYSIDEYAETLYQALSMPEEEQEQRMTRLRLQVDRCNIYRWAGRLLTEASLHMDARQPVGDRV